MRKALKIVAACLPSPYGGPYGGELLFTLYHFSHTRGLRGGGRGMGGEISLNSRESEK